MLVKQFVTPKIKIKPKKQDNEGIEIKSSQTKGMIEVAYGYRAGN